MLSNDESLEKDVELATELLEWMAARFAVYESMSGPLGQRATAPVVDSIGQLLSDFFRKDLVADPRFAYLKDLRLKA